MHNIKFPWSDRNSSISRAESVASRASVASFSPDRRSPASFRERSSRSCSPASNASSSSDDRESSPEARKSSPEAPKSVREGRPKIRKSFSSRKSSVDSIKSSPGSARSSSDSRNSSSDSSKSSSRDSSSESRKSGPIPSLPLPIPKLRIKKSLIERSCNYRNVALMINEFKSYFPVLRIRIRLDPFHFGQPDPDPGSKKSAKIMENFHKNQTKSEEYHTFIFKNNKLMFEGHNIYPINNKTEFFGEIYFSFPLPFPFLLHLIFFPRVLCMHPCIQFTRLDLFL